MPPRDFVLGVPAMQRWFRAKHSSWKNFGGNFVFNDLAFSGIL